jgi:hypothetical protein
MALNALLETCFLSRVKPFFSPPLIPFFFRSFFYFCFLFPSLNLGYDYFVEQVPKLLESGSCVEDNSCDCLHLNLKASISEDLVDFVF